MRNVVYPAAPHTTADDPKRYRTDDEVADWRARDPLTRVHALLGTMGVDTDALEREVADEAGRTAAELRAAVTTIPDPEPMTVFDHVYAEPNSHVARQREHYARYLAMFDDADAAASGAEGAAR